MKPCFLRNAACLFVLGLPFAMPGLAQTDAAPAAPAQTDAPPQGGPHRGGPEHRVEMLQHSLNLTPDQTTQVKAILLAEHGKMEALHSNAAVTGEDRHTQMMAIHQETDAKLKSIFTTDQATKYDAMEARMRQHRPGDGGPPPPPSDAQAPGER